MRAAFWKALCALWLISLGLAAPLRADAIEDAINAELRRQDIPGLAVAVVERGRVVRLSGHGLANLEHRVPVTPDTVFQGGSTAKQFTALGILLLAADGKLALDDPLSRYLPDVPRRWRDISLRHLMVQTSGLGEDPPRADYQRSPAQADLRRLFYTTPKTRPAGAAWAYSNTGYAMLGMVIEKVTGQPYHRFLEQRLFRPLGMTATTGINEAAIIANRAAGYEREGGKLGAPLRNQAWVSQVFNSTADGSTYITARDFATFLAALDNPPAQFAPHFAQIVKPVAPIAKDSAVSYGFGWFVTRIDGREVLFHSGSWQGFRVHMIRYPQQQTSVVMLANSDIPERAALVRAVLGAVLPGMPAPPGW
ncbi:MAG TPA: serine hydrolase domain-containing protein [Novosphingobium sp.]|nr:serine hydrolase domain-containing protein [Novosphingobium sp.]